jgi:hypothetical protein
MLVNKTQNYQIGDIVGFKMISGDEIVGKLAGIESKTYELNKPCIVITSENGIGLMQAMFSLDPQEENLIIKDDHVIAKCQAHMRMQEHYIKVTSQDNQE